MSISSVEARRVLMLLNYISLRTRRALLLHKVYCDKALLVLNETLWNSISTLLALIRRHVDTWFPSIDFGKFCVITIISFSPTHPWNPPMTAWSLAVQPLLSLMSILALLSSNILTTPIWSFWQASIRGVLRERDTQIINTHKITWK